MIPGRSLVPCREQNHLACMTVNQIYTSREVVADRKPSIRRSANMPQTTALFCLASDNHLPGFDVYNSESGWLFARTGWTPLRLLTGISAMNIGAVLNIYRNTRNFPVPHNCKSNFIGRNYCFVSDPLIF